MAEYTLNIAYSKKAGGSLTIKSGDSFSVTRTQSADISADDSKKVTHKYRITLTSLSYTKRIYHPCQIDAELSFFLLTNEGAVVTSPADNDSAMPSIGDLKTWFGGAKGNLSWSEGSTVSNVAEGYKVFDCMPGFRFDAEGNRQLFLKLKIQSPDAAMERGQYSRVHVAKRLGSIVDGENAQFGSIPVVKQWQFLSYSRKYKEDVSGKKVEKTKSDELIQPYLVQYNETFYAFLRRTANRCGEFVYFENGKLNLGLAYDASKVETQKKIIDKYDKVSIHCSNAVNSSVDTSLFHRDAISDKTVTSLYKYAQSDDGKSITLKKKDTTLAAGCFPYKLLSAYDEYLLTVERDKYDSTGEQWKVANGGAVTAPIAQFLSGRSLLEGIENLAYSSIKEAIMSAQRAQNGNSTFNKYFDNTPFDSTSYDIVEGSDDDKKTLAEFATHSKQFSGGHMNVDSNLISLVYSVQSRLWTEAIDIDCGASLQNVHLGDCIQLTTTDTSRSYSDRTYVVVEISGKGVLQDNATDSMRLVAVPSYSGNPPFPPAIPEGPIRKSGPQTAFVSSSFSNDERRLCRIKIRYPWQKDTGQSALTSPWVRTLSTLATADGGNYFCPSEGDEVLLDYEDGNIERPYVTGYLFNGGTGKTPLGTRGYSNYVSTRSGQSVRVMDASDPMLMFAGLYPGIKLLRMWNVPGAFDKESDWKEVLGSIEFTDMYGLYSLKMDSANRAVSVTSPFGKVSINALTGIEFNAPNGDINISGKNISIKAGNNVTMEAGANIVDKFQLFSAMREKGVVGGFGSYLAMATSNVAGKIIGEFFDLSVIRTLAEMVLKPVGGTLKIHSNRNLVVEAGEGKANIPVETLNTGQGKRFTSAMLQQNVVESQVARQLDQIAGICNALYAQAGAKITVYTEAKATYPADDQVRTKQGSEILNAQFFADPVAKADIIAQQDTLEKFNTKFANAGQAFTQDQMENYQHSAETIAQAVNGVLNLGNAFALGNLVAKSPYSSNLEDAFKKMKDKIGCMSMRYNDFKDFADVAAFNGSKFGDAVAVKKMKRMLAWEYAKDVCSSLHLAMPATAPTEADFEDDAKWAKLCSGIGPQNIISSTISNVVMNKLLGSVTTPFVDAFAWGDQSSGRVLMSQLKGKTIRFADAGSQVVQRDEGFVNKLTGIGMI